MIKARRFSHVTFETPDIDRQIAYFTEINGLALADRVNGRAYLATKHGDLAVTLEAGSHARCARLAFQVAPETEFDDIRKLPVSARSSSGIWPLWSLSRSLSPTSTAVCSASASRTGFRTGSSSCAVEPTITRSIS